MRLHAAFALAACLVMVTTADAQRNRLSVGDAAPSLEIEKWVHGGPVSIESGNVYVVEFWATWCGPCRRAIPHLTELQNRYEADGLRIIGISDEDEDVVRRFVQGQGSQISYTIAVDNRGSMTRSWMSAAGQRGIPSAFIVDQRGRIQFIGNPNSDDFTRVLQLVMGGRYDAKLFEQVRPLVQAFEQARRVRNWRQCFHYLDEIIKADSFIFAPYALTKFEVMMVDMEDTSGAYRYARSLLSEYADDPAFLADLAEKIATDAQISNDKRDLDLAMEAAKAAVQAERNNPRMLAVQAMVHYQKGEKDDAVRLQRRAWMIAAPDRKSGYERVLRRYQDSASDSRASSRPSWR